VVTLINRAKYDVIDANMISKDFEVEYGLIVPYHPMVSILTRAIKRGYITRSKKGTYQPVKDKVIADDFTDIAAEQERKYQKVIGKFLQFCSEKYGEQLTEADADAVYS
jgi:hypothetical protein